MRKHTSIRSSLGRIRDRLSEQLAEPKIGERNAQTRSRDFRIRVTVCAVIFVVALGVRLLHWSDRHTEIERGTTMVMTLVRPYVMDARETAENGGLVFPGKSEEPPSERLLLHPPGYPILLRALYGDGQSDDFYWQLRLFQILADSTAAVLVFLIAAELVSMSAAIIAALLVGLSPHFAQVSLQLSPESLAVVPILIGVYLIARSRKRPSILLTASAGVMLGISCWLRANGLLLAPFLALVIFVCFARGKRLRHAAILIAATLLTISPITIRNWIVYRQFIPLSSASGITLIEGMADYDEQRRFDVQATDGEVARREAEIYGEPDYERDLWTPRGVERDRARFARGVAIIRSNPVWFLGVMVRRATFMLRYNDSGASNWPINTRLVPFVSTEAPFMHSIVAANETPPLWSSSPAELLVGATISPNASVSVTDDGSILNLRGSRAGYDDQFVSRPIEVEKNTDYLLAFEFNLAQGNAAAKVTSLDTRVTLGSAILAVAAADDRKRERSRLKAEGLSAAHEDIKASLRIPFASGDRNQVRVALSNDGAVPPVLNVGRFEILRAGPTQYVWTRYPRALIRGLQKNLFVTSRMLPLVVIGVALLAVGRGGQRLAILLAVPFYYMCVHSAVHTEYRYIIAMHYFLFVIAAVPLSCLGIAAKQAWTAAVRRVVS